MNGFKILVIERDGYFVAQSLEKHVVVQARTLEDLQMYFIDTLMTYAFLDELADVPPLSSLEPAPPEVWEQWNAANPLVLPSADKYDFRLAA